MATINNSGRAKTVALSATGSQAITIDAQYTILDGVTTIATGNRTLDLTIDSEVGAGARIVVFNKTTGTETFIAGTNVVGPTVTGTAGKTKSWELVYDGTSFKTTNAAVQID